MKIFNYQSLNQSLRAKTLKKALVTGLFTGLALTTSFASSSLTHSELSKPEFSQSVLSDSQQSIFNEADNRLRENINQLLAEHHLPGMVLMIKHKGEVIHFDAYGKVNVDKPEPMDKNALFRIYSMSKPITAFGLLQLVDKGKVSLDDDIRQYLPEFEPFEVDGNLHTVTVHHLLSHTAGFGYGGGFKNWVDIRYLLANPLSRSNSLDDLVDDLSGIDLKFAPGERFNYSIASDIQGAIIEKVSGLSLDAYFKTHIFNPLGMTDTSFTIAKDQENRLVDMYEFDAETFENAKTFKKEQIEFIELAEDSEFLESPELLSGGGGLVSTAQDYAKFVTLLASGGQYSGKTLLSKHLADKMLSSHTQGLDTHFLPRVFSDTGFGYGVGVKEQDGENRHKGAFFWAGLGGTLFWADPKAELEVVAMMQVEDGWIALDNWLVPQVYELIDSNL